MKNIKNLINKYQTGMATALACTIFASVYAYDQSKEPIRRLEDKQLKTSQKINDLEYKTHKFQISEEKEEIEKETYRLANPDLFKQINRNPLKNLLKKTPKSHEVKPRKTSPKYEKPCGEKLYALSRGSDNIISNEFFRNYSYLNEDQIKNLLIRNNSCLKNTGVEKTIIQAAQENEINPLYILGRLQQEQRLLTKPKASKNALKYATGYGARDDKTLPSGGLHYQVRKTAEGFNKFANEFDGTQILKINYETATIKPKNAAQYALYKYTPHTEGFNLANQLLIGINKKLSY